MAPPVPEAAVTGAAAEESSNDDDSIERPLLTMGSPFEPRRIFSLKPSSSTANSVSSERFMRSMICLICLRSKGSLGCKLNEQKICGKQPSAVQNHSGYSSNLGIVNKPGQTRRNAAKVRFI